MTGNNGWCNLLNAQTGHWVHGFKIEGTIVDFAFANDESFIMIVNSAGEVWEFALEGKITSKTPNKIIRRWYDDGGVGITKLQIGGKTIVGSPLVTITDSQYLRSISICS